MKFVVGCDLEEFKRYYRTLEDLHDYFKTLGLAGVVWEELGVAEESIIKGDPSHLIIWRENDEIIGHAIWHETNTEEHRAGVSREKKDREILEKLLGRKRDFVELHEIWLRKKHRGKGFGKRFFEFFEDFIRKRGYDSIVYYTDNPAASAICRKRGYREDFFRAHTHNWYVFHLSLDTR